MANEVLFWQGDKVSALAAGRQLGMDDVTGFYASAGTLTGDGTVVAAGDTVTIDLETYSFVASLTEANAAGTLTGTGIAAANGETVTIDSQTYTFKTALTEAKAVGTLTGDGTKPSDGDTVTINGVVYTFQAILTNAAGHVLIAADAAGTLTNLFHAINASGGTVGTDYAALCVPHPGVIATNPTGTTVVLTARAVGTAANAFGTTVYSAGTAHVAFGATTLLGGVNSVANEVLVGTAAQGITRLYEAINAGANIGVDYSSATVIHPTVSATNPTGTTLVATAKTPGVAGNDLVTSDTSANLAWGATTLLGGVNSVANQVVIGTAAQSLTHLYEAINGGANAGVDYSSATVTHPTVSATNPSATTVVLAGLGSSQQGGSINSIATIAVSAHAAFGAATLLGGSDSDVIVDPITGYPRYATYALVTPASPSGDIAFALPMGDEAQEVCLYLKTKTGGNAVVAGAFVGGTHLTFSAANQIAKLKFLNGSWLPLVNTGAIA